MRYWKAAIIFAVAFFIQTSLLNVISIKGYTPNLLLCLVIVFSFLYEDGKYGIIFGVICGLMYDICFSSVLGPTPLALLCTSVVVLLARESANIENIVNLWILSAVSLVIYYLVSWGLFHIGGNPEGLVFVLRRLPWTGLYSLAVITVIYLILIRKETKHRKDRYFR